jgi:hypothetical protein
MDKRVEAGLKGGFISWIIVLVVGVFAFFIAGFCAVLLGRTSIKNQNDVVIASLVAGLISMVAYIVVLPWGILLFLLPFFAGALSLLGGIICAKYMLKIPIDIHKIEMPRIESKPKSIVQKPSKPKSIVQKPSKPKSVAKKSISSKKFCPGCGREVGADWKVCPYCRSELESIFCPSCGHANPLSSTRCQRCGSSLDDGTMTYDDGTRVY